LNGGLTLYTYTWAHNSTVPYTLSDVTVGGQGVLTLVSYDTLDVNYTNDYGLNLTVDTLNVQTGGKVTADGLGYSTTATTVSGQNKGRGPGAGNGGFCYTTGSSHGGWGIKSLTSTYELESPYGNVYQPISLGSSSATYGKSSAGGGAIKITAGTLTLDGTISADGTTIAAGDACNTGGTGGSIWLDVGTLNGSGGGVVSVSGALGGGTNPYGYGAGGRLAIYYTTDNLNIGNAVNTGKIKAYGGKRVVGSDTYVSGAGTIYLEHKGVDTAQGGALYVDNNNNIGGKAGLVEDSYEFNLLSLKRGGALEVLGQASVLTLSDPNAIVGDISMPDLTVSGTFNYTGSGTLTINGIDLGINGEITGVSDFDLGTTIVGGLTLYANTWAHNNLNQYSFSDINVGAQGTMTLDSNDTGDTNYLNDYGVNLTLDSLNVQNGGKVTADGLGYSTLNSTVAGQSKGRGPGAGNGGFCNTTAPSYGGFGFKSLTSVYAVETVYGNVYEPVDLGSSSATYTKTNPGGGAIKITTTTLTVDGTISADAVTDSISQCNTGGTGGSIWIDTGTLNGASTGVISSSGTSGGTVKNYGYGSGGRIAIYYTTDNLGIQILLW